MKRFAAVAVLLSLAFACAAGAQSRAGKSRYAALLDNPTTRLKLMSLAAMEFAGHVNSQAIANLATHKEALVRVRCAEVLGRVGDRSAVPLLAKLAADPDLRVAETAIYSLGLVHDTAAVAPLRKALGSTSEELQARAIEALGKTGKKEAAPVIAPFLRHFKAELRAQAALALAFAGDSASASECDAIIQDDDQRVAACAAYAMGRLGYKAGIGRIVPLLASPDAEARLRAAEALGRLKASSAVSAIAPLTQDADRWVAIKAAEALQRIASAAGDDALAAMLASEDVYLRTLGLNGLAVVGEKKHLEAIAPLLDDPSAMVRRAALGAVARAAGDDARQYLLAAVEKRTPHEAMTALELLGTIGDKRDLPLLCAKLGDRELLVAEGAAGGLGNWKDPGDLRKPLGDGGASKNATPIDALLAATRGDDWVIASIAIESLGKAGAVDRIPDLAAIYDAKDSRIDGDRRLAVIQAIDANADRLGGEKASGRGVDALLAKAAADPDARVAAAARDAATKLKITIAAAPSEPADRGAYPWGGPAFPLGQKTIVVSTPRGEIEILLYGDDAPNAVSSIIHLARTGFYNGQTFHRIVPAFVIQGGCPRGDGWGDAGYYLRNERNLYHYRRGTVGLADSGLDTAGSQFFIMHTEHPHLDGRYTIVGRVTRGMNVVDRIEEGDTFTVKVVE